MMLRALALLIAISTALGALGPEPGDVYKEYRLAMAGDEWRVTDPDAGHKGAAKFLPNPVLEVEIDDLDGATRAEILIDRWGGHPGTSNKRFRFNGHDWITIPELATTPAGHLPVCYMSQDNPVVEVPLRHLTEGVNNLEATCGDQLCFSFRWGQWGWNAAIVRIYYDAGKPHPTGRIVSPLPGATLGEGPVLEADTSGDADRVDFLAHYTGYDENGDGVFTDWHRAYFYNRRVEATGADPKISHHAGSAFTASFRATWSTRWVPDQPDGKLKLVARIRGADGTWFVADTVENLTLER
ncbi:MAG: hypothetical protein GY778_14465, partial [bacterium]|nr:hypothetical protein [bacterium]